MKKLILMICLAILLSGCVDTKPSDWNVGEETSWEIWAEGTIVSITEKPASSYWEYSFSTGKTIDIRNIRNPGTVNTGQKGILYRNMGMSQDDKDAWFQWITEGTEPRVIRHNIAAPVDEETEEILTEKPETVITGSIDITDSNAIRFEAMNKSIDNIFSSVDEIIAERDALRKKAGINHEWQKAENIKDIDTHEIVLIILDDGIITTGFVTYDKLWKLGINLNAYKGGRTIEDVAKWRRLDLE